jgi:hypothetical protein
MTPESEELLMSMTDGATVDPDLLAAALSEPDAAVVLVDFARVRQAVEADAEPPRETFTEELRQCVSRGPAWWSLGPRTPLVVVAALVLLAVVSGAWVGRATQPAPQQTLIDLTACADPRGTAYEPGDVTAINGQRVRCVVRAEWMPVSR